MAKSPAEIYQEREGYILRMVSSLERDIDKLLVEAYKKGEACVFRLPFFQAWTCVAVDENGVSLPTRIMKRLESVYFASGWKMSWYGSAAEATMTCEFSPLQTKIGSGMFDIPMEITSRESLSTPPGLLLHVSGMYRDYGQPFDVESINGTPIYRNKDCKDISSAIGYARSARIQGEGPDRKIALTLFIDQLDDPHFFGCMEQETRSLEMRMVSLGEGPYKCQSISFWG